MKGNDAAVIAEIPAAGNAGLRRQRMGILNREALKERSNQLIFRYACNNVRVQTLRL